MSSTPEQVQQYLLSKNINGLLKWITTELVIHKPEDPLTFIYYLTQKELLNTDTTTKPYSYSTDFLEQLIIATRNKSIEDIQQENIEYSVPVSSANINTNTNTKNNTNTQNNNTNNSTFRLVSESVRRIASEIDPKIASKLIIEETRKVLQCEQAILYTFDDEKQELTDSHSHSRQSTTTTTTTTAAAKSADALRAALDGKHVINAQSNALCLPLKDFQSGNVYGVIECRNKSGGFSAADVEILESLGTQAVITLQNGIIYEMGLAEKKRNSAMIALWRLFKDFQLKHETDISINSLLFTMTRKCLEIVNAEKCTFYFINHAQHTLWSMQGEVNISMSMDIGIAGFCATNAQLCNISDVYKSEKFDQSTDKKTGFRTRSMLCVPMISSLTTNSTNNSNNSNSNSSSNQNGKTDTGTETVIGVIQFINKLDGLDFDQSDEHILELVLSAAAPIFEKSKLFQTSNKNAVMGANSKKTSISTDDKFVNDTTVSPSKSGDVRNLKSLAEEQAIPEGNEEEED